MSDSDDRFRVHPGRIRGTRSAKLQRRDGRFRCAAIGLLTLDHRGQRAFGASFERFRLTAGVLTVKRIMDMDSTRLGGCRRPKVFRIRGRALPATRDMLV